MTRWAFMKRPAILITGFGEFPGAPANPTEHAINRLRHQYAGREDLAFGVLDTDYKTGLVQLERLRETLQPDVILMAGLHAVARCIRLELAARNQVSTQRKDRSGFIPADPVIAAEAPSSLHTGLPVPAIMAALRARQIDFEVSRHAGDYLCNYVYFKALDHCRLSDRASPHVIFVHTPLTDDLILPYLQAGGVNEVYRTIPPQTLDDALMAIANAVCQTWESR